MTKKQELVAKRAELFKEVSTLNESIVTRSLKSEDVSADQKKYDELKRSVEQMDTLIAQQDELRSKEEAYNKPADRVVIGSADSKTDEQYRSAYESYLHTGATDELRSLNSFTAGEGGAAVSAGVATQIFDNLRGNSVIRKLNGVEIIRTQKTTKIPVAVTDPSAAKVAQGPSGSYSEGNITFQTATLDAYKFGNIVKVSEELVSDAEYDIVSYVNTAIAGAQSIDEEAKFISGSGTNETKGLFAYTNGTDVTVLSGSVVDGLIDAAYSSAALRQNGVYIVTPALAKSARKAKDTNGQLLWAPAVAGQPETFNGRPFFVTDGAGVGAMTAGAVAGVYVVPSSITIGDRTPFSVTRLNELYAAEGFVGFKYSFRTDMVVKNPAKSLARLIIG